MLGTPGLSASSELQRPENRAYTIHQIHVGEDQVAVSMQRQ